MIRNLTEPTEADPTFAGRHDADPASRYLVRYILAYALLFSSLQAQTRQRPQFLGIAHVAYRVSDLDRTELFYGSLLGYEEPFSLNDGSKQNQNRLRQGE